MKHKHLIVLLFTAIAVFTALSCSTNDTVVRSQSADDKTLNSRLPGGFKNAEPWGMDRDSSFIVLLPAPGTILLQKADARPIDLRVLGEKLHAFGWSKISPDKRVVYIGAVASVETAELEPILSEVTKNDIDTIIFLTKSDMKDALVFRAKLAPPAFVKSVIERDPLSLVVRKGSGSKFLINKRQFDDLDTLGNGLAEIFREREEKRILRPGSPEIVKTVVIQLASFKTHGDLLTAIDTVKGSGADPIGLILNK